MFFLWKEITTKEIMVSLFTTKHSMSFQTRAQQKLQSPSHPHIHTIMRSVLFQQDHSLSLSLSLPSHTLSVTSDASTPLPRSCLFDVTSTGSVSLTRVHIECSSYVGCFPSSHRHWQWSYTGMQTALYCGVTVYSSPLISTPPPRILVISKHSVRTHHPSKREQKCSISSIIHRRHLCAPPISGSARPLMGMEEPSLSPPLTIAHPKPSSPSASSKLSSTFCLFVVSFQATIQCVRAFKRIMNHCFVAMSAS